MKTKIFPLLLLALLFCRPAFCGENTIVEKNLAGYWSFNEGSGYIIHDSSGNGRSGLIGGDWQWTNGHSGGGLWFNGKNTQVTTVVRENFLKQGAEDQPFSICVWVKPEIDCGVEHLIAGKTGCHAGIIANSTNGENTFSFQIWKPQGAAGGIFRIKTPPIANFDQWHFVAAVYDQRTVTLSVDGKEAIRGVLKSDMRAYDDFFTIGGSGFKGTIGEARLYTRSLTPSDISALMANNKTATVAATPTPKVKKVSLVKDRPILTQPLFDKKLALAHYMTANVPGLWDIDPANYRPDGPLRNIGGERYLVLSGYYYTNRSLEDFAEYEMRTAKSLGIDGFNFFYPYMPSGGDLLSLKYNEIIRTFIDVADKKNLDFKISLCLCSPRGTEPSETKIIAFARRIGILLDSTKNSPHWLRSPDGRIVFFTWCLEGLADGVADTTDIFRKPNVEENVKALAEAYESLAEAIGIKPAFVYHLHTVNSPIHDFNHRYANAVFDYFPAATGWMDVVPFEDDGWNYIINAARERKRFYGQSLFNDFSDSKIYLKNGKFPNFFDEIRNVPITNALQHYVPLAGSSMFRALCERAVTNDASFISYATWNDYGEGHHLAPEINHNFAFSFLLRYYENIWRKAPQTVNGDIAMVFYRKYPTAAMPSLFNIQLEYRGTKAQRTMLEAGQDVIEVVTILDSAADVFINGKKRGEANAGLSAISIPMEIGKVHVEVKRAGKAIIDLTPPEWITDKPYRSDRLTYAFSSKCLDMYKELFGEVPPVLIGEYAEDTNGVPNWKKRYSLPPAN
jgi:hypothetical protein